MGNWAMRALLSLFFACALSFLSLCPREKKWMLFNTSIILPRVSHFIKAASRRSPTQPVKLSLGAVQKRFKSYSRLASVKVAGGHEGHKQRSDFKFPFFAPAGISLLTLSAAETMTDTSVESPEHIKQDTASTTTWQFAVEITCGGCVKSISSLLDKTEAVKTFEVSLEKQEVVVQTGTCYQRENYIFLIW